MQPWQKLSTASPKRCGHRFNVAFWCEEIGTYALALDGVKRPCRVRSSNAGHALFTGIADPAYAARVADSLTGRKPSAVGGSAPFPQGESRYNPISLSQWFGLAARQRSHCLRLRPRYGLKAQAAKVFSGMFDAASCQDLRRLPELFCGFGRRSRRGPTDYPVACAPQAWASAAPFAFLSACIGLSLRYDSNEIRITDPRLPDSSTN